MPKGEPNNEISRRRFLVAGAGAVAGAALWPGQPARAVTPGTTTTAGTGLTATGGTALTLDPSTASSWSVAKTVFGRFFEVIERKAYPGIIDQHLANGSFEEWWIKGKGSPPWFRKSEVLYHDTPYFPDKVAYPWEPVPADGVTSPQGVTFEMPEGGVHGRRPYDIVEATQRFQRVRMLDATGGVRQRLALPDDRTLDYDLSISVRGEGISSLDIRMVDSAGEIVARTSVGLSTEWKRHEVRLRLSHASPTRYHNDWNGHDIDTYFGEFALLLTATGTGYVDLDFATLMAGDAVRGKFNPTTLKHFREYGIGSMRWPGGNYTSSYHWEHGIGPWQERAVTTNQVWGGLDYYYFGLPEYLEFCELTDMEPYINLGFNLPGGRGHESNQIPPEEAARAVEYCNGDLTTAMGKLRAEHGHPQPYHVKQWQIGNEVWGPLQNGHVDATTYGQQFRSYYDAMKAVDPTIKVYASGSDVWHLRLGDPPGTPPKWNTDFIEAAGADYVDGLDIHNYVVGIKAAEADERKAFMAEHGLDPVTYNQLLVGYSTAEDRAITILREQARERGVENLQLTYGEFNTNSMGAPGWPETGWPIIHWETVANSAFVAGMYNTFIRQGDAVRHSHLVDYTIYHRPSTDDWWPLSPSHYVSQMYSEPFRMKGLTWHKADVAIDGPTFDIPDDHERMMPTKDVPYVDSSCLIANNRQTAFVFAVNRDLRNRRQVTLSAAGWPPGVAGAAPKVSARMLSSVPEDNPFAQERSLGEPTTSKITEFTVTPDADGKITLELPPAGVIRLRLDAITN